MSNREATEGGEEAPREVGPHWRRIEIWCGKHPPPHLQIEEVVVTIVHLLLKMWDEGGLE